MPHEHHFDPERLLSWEEERRTILDPAVVIADLCPRTDMTLADIGAGVGFFALEAAKHLTDGRVLALDRDPRMLETIAARAQTGQLNNVETLQADAVNLPLPDHSVDVVLLANVLHDLPQQDQALAEVARVLRVGGRLGLVEWDRVPTPHGPPLEIRLSPPELVQLLEHAGFAVDWVKQEAAPFYRVCARPNKPGV